VPRAVGINHIALEVGSIDEALDFYGRLFDLELRGRIRGMAFVDMGDQFIALAEGRTQEPDRHRHFGLVVDDREAVLAAAREAGAAIFGGNSFLDPWGNHVQVVDYADVQFSKTPEVLRGMGLELQKSESALRELRDKGLSQPGS
jgi:predicted enzyme related to lactoylglutathione lyase